MHNGQRDDSMKVKFILLIFITSIVGCVSVKIPTTTIEKAKNVSFKAPAAPFKSARSLGADEMWTSATTASTISFFTSCSNSEPALKTIRATAFSSLEGMEVTKEEFVNINARQGLKSIIEGRLEGVPVKIQFLVFKKNSCSYHLSYVALKENFEKELSFFNTFINNFRVP